MSEVWRVKGLAGMQFATKNLVRGRSVYGERLFEVDGVEYREWQHKKSKLASGLINQVRLPTLKPGARVLYLGASSGTTVSHVSDIVDFNGIVFAVEFAPRPGRDLYKLAEVRPNIVPILADARFPETYSNLVDGVDLLYCDVAQPSQSELFVKNAEYYLKDTGQAYIAIKTKSISQRMDPKKIFEQQVKYMEKAGLQTVKTANISKIHRDHFVFLGKWK